MVPILHLRSVIVFIGSNIKILSLPHIYYSNNLVILTWIWTNMEYILFFNFNLYGIIVRK